MQEENIEWQLFIEGDASSFEKIMRVYYKPLLNYGLKFSLDRELVKDCIQDLFLKIWDNRKTLSLSVHIKAYLFASLRRLLHRKLTRSSKVLLSNTVQEEFEAFHIQVSIEDEFIKDENTLQLAKRIVDSLKCLPGRQKEVIYLRFFQELTREEIAEAMGISPQTVSNLMQMAIKKLKGMLSPSFDLSLLPLIFTAIIKDSL